MDFKEKSKNARAFIVLLAAMITEILNIKYDRELLNSMIILLVVIIVFFVIATVAIKLVEKILNMDNSNTEYITDDANEEDRDVSEESAE